MSGYLEQITAGGIEVVKVKKNKCIEVDFNDKPDAAVGAKRLRDAAVVIVLGEFMAIVAHIPLPPDSSASTTGCESLMDQVLSRYDNFHAWYYGPGDQTKAYVVCPNTGSYASHMQMVHDKLFGTGIQEIIMVGLQDGAARFAGKGTIVIRRDGATGTDFASVYVEDVRQP